MANEIELTTAPDLSLAEGGKVPRWVHETYPGMEQDIWQYLHSFYYLEQVKERDAMPRSPENKAQVSANAHMKSVTQTMALKDATDRSTFLQLYYAHKSGWPGMTGMEGVQDLLANLTDAYSSKGAISEMTFIVRVLIPELERLGTPPELVFGLAENISKARASVSTFRHLLSDGGEDNKKEIKALLGEVGDPRISLRQFRENTASRMEKREPIVKVKASAHIYLIPGGEIVIIESTPAHSMAIEHSLKGIAGDFSVKSGIELLKFINQRLTPKKEDMKRYNVRNGEVVRAGNGRLMPTPEKFYNLCVQEVINGKFLIEQLLAISGKALVPIYISETNLPKGILKDWLVEAFHYEGVKPEELISIAFNTFYFPTPPEVVGLWPHATYMIMTSYQKMGGSWGVFLEITTR
jgi:hypothetical protein